MSYNNQLAVSLNDIGQIRHILSVLHRKGDRKYGQKRPENPAYPDADPSGIYQPAPRKACSEHFRQGALRKSGHQPGGTFYTHYTDIYDLMHQMEDEMMADIQTALKPLLDSDISDLTPLKITTGIFRCLKENADLCAVTLGKYGDREFATRLLTIGRERCLESYSKYFAQATPKQIEYYYSFVSAGCIGLLEKWLADGMATSAEEIASAAENIMMKGIHFLE